MKGRFVDTPDLNSVVILGIWNPKQPTVRFYFGTIVNLVSRHDIFEKENIEEDYVGDIWKNVINSTDKSFGHFPGEKGRPLIPSKGKKINFRMGIRGKGKNFLLFEEKKTTLVQNSKENNESKLVLDDKASLTAQNIDILSTNNKGVTQRPVFANPLFSFMQQQLTLTALIVTVLTTIPSMMYGVIPNTPNPAAMPLAGQMSQLLAKFTQLRVPGNGSSKYININ